MSRIMVIEFKEDAEIGDGSEFFQNEACGFQYNGFEKDGECSLLEEGREKCPYKTDGGDRSVCPIISVVSQGNKAGLYSIAFKKIKEGMMI